MGHTRRSLGLSALALIAASTAAGCNSCNRDKPYVPWTIDSSTPVSVSVPTVSISAQPPPPPSGSAGFARVAGQPAPPGATNLTVGGLAITAPTGRVFLTSVNVTTPGQPAQVAAVVGDGGSLSGEVVLYRSDGGKVVGPTKLAALPSWLPSGQGCNHMPQIAQVGPSTVWVDIASVCTKQEAQKKPNRYLAALSTQAPSPVRVELRASDPGPGERLAVDADASDRDGDGSDDLTVHVAIEGALSPLAGTPRASASLRYLGRPAGMSRDPAEPALSMRQLASWQGAQAAKKDHAEAALGNARAIRRLFSALCTEGGAPSLTDGDGQPIVCGDAQLLDEARFAEGRAALTLGNPAAAFATAARLRDPKAKTRRAADLDAAIEAQLKPRTVTARPLKVMPVASAVALPFSFDDKGQLVVLGEEGIVRVDPASAAESPAEGVTRWGPFAELVSDLKVDGASDPCKGDLVRLRIKGGSGSRDLPVPLLGATPPLCTPDAQLSPVLLARDADGLTALVAGEAFAIERDGERARPVPFPTAPTGPGTARSPDGKWLAVTSPEKVMLVREGKGELWKPQPRFTFSACTVANDAKAAACALERGIVLLTP